MSKDLFDDSTMTFGEHLEVLRVHLWKAIIGLVLGFIIALCFSNHVIIWIQKPVQDALEKTLGPKAVVPLAVDTVPLWDHVKGWFGQAPEKPATAAPEAAEQPPAKPEIVLQIDARNLIEKIKTTETNAAAQNEDVPAGGPLLIDVTLTTESLERLRADVQKVVDAEIQQEMFKARTDAVDEAFMLYVKVSFAMGIVIASPWIFYQLWLFVAAGLYPHERKYVNTYLPISIGLFLGGVLFCFFAVIPFVLNYLFWFNEWLHLRAEMKIGTWISFAFWLSLMFGVSFQLPLVMLFLERISLFSVNDYREKRRMAILVISIISMVLTPAEPMSMILMMVSLCFLFEVGILLCGKGIPKSPFEARPA